MKKTTRTPPPPNTTAPSPTAMADKKQRVEWIDFCRVYTAFCVILRHCDRHYGYPAYVIDLFNYRSLIFFFFLMAGYFTHTARAGQWLDWGRARRLALPYLFWGLLALCTMQPLMHLGQVSHGDWSWLSPLTVVKELGLRSWCYWDYSNVPLWFLRTLILLSLASPLLQRLRAKPLLCLVLICAAASDVLCESDAETAAHYKRHGVAWLPFRTYESVLALGFYAGGLLLRRYATTEQLTAFVRSYAWLPVLGALALLPAVYCWGFYPPVQSSALVLLGVATTLSLGCLCERYLPRLCHFIAQWGPAAFFVYVTHYLLLEGLRTLLTGRYGGSLSVWQAAWAPFAILAVSLALYALLCRLAPGFMRLFALAPTAGQKST